MSPPRSRFTLFVGIFCAGLVAGVYLQHRWPLGRLRSAPRPDPIRADLSLENLARLPRFERLVVVGAGQSNAANYGSTRANGGPGVYAYASGRVYRAIDPLPGAGGDGGSIWTRFGAQLIAKGRYKAVLVAALAQGSTRVDDWAPGGSCHRRLIDTLDQLRQAGLPADFILWQQGETEAWSADASGQQYAASLRALVASCRPASPQTRFVIAHSTYGHGVIRNAQIGSVQAAAESVGAIAGPDLDQLGAEFRSDGAHFNDRGLALAAELWIKSLAPFLPPTT